MSSDKILIVLNSIFFLLLLSKVLNLLVWRLYIFPLGT